MSNEVKKKKRLSLGFSLSTKEKEQTENMELNDDEAEKRERRKSRQLDVNADSDDQEDASGKVSLGGNKLRRKSGAVPASIPKSVKDMIDNSQKNRQALSNSELVEMYANAIKLSSENKINAKNSWQLNLIDYIDDVIEVQQTSNGDETMTNFQVASVTLDASVKIYSCRVDSVHNETFKVLGGLSRTGNRGEEGEGQKEDGGPNDQDASKEQEDPEAKKQKKAKRITEVGGVNTLESNPDNISVRKFDLAFDVDPLFKKTSAAFDEGGAKGLLLNHLSVYDNGQIIFDSSDAILEDTTAAVASDQVVDIIELERKISPIVDDIHVLQICPTFANFKFNRDDKDKDDDNDDNADFNLELDDDDVPEGIQPGIDIDDDEAIEQKEAHLMQEIMQTQHEDEDGAPPVVNEPISQNDDLFSQSQAAKQPLDLPFLLAAASDFSHFDPKMLQNWAGPNHWKFRAPKETVTADGAVVTKEGKKSKRKKAAFHFDFSAPDTTDYTKAFSAPVRGGTTLSTAALKKAAQSNNNLLPPDIHYDVKMLTQLFNKPKWRISMHNRRKRLAQEGLFDSNKPEVGAAFHADEDDDQFMPMVQEGQDGYNSDDDNHADFFIQPVLPENAGELNLVAEPRKVEQIKIGYAKSAKFVDVKALKDTIWKEFKESETKHKADKGVPKFTELLLGIPQNVPADALPNISVPFAFICLLHLANEKGIMIEQKKGDLEELIVHQ